MKLFTVHTRGNASPILVREGFSLWAFLFGWIWLAVHRAWIPAAITLALVILNAVLLHGPARTAVGLGLAMLSGLVGRDLVRWSLARRGFAPGPAVLGRNADYALVRLVESERRQNAPAPL